MNIHENFASLRNKLHLIMEIFRFLPHRYSINEVEFNNRTLIFGRYDNLSTPANEERKKISPSREITGGGDVNAKTIQIQEFR